jgi:hypothetical protein
VSWNNTDGREVGYWLGREFWGQGIATQALALFLEEEPTRPLVAHVAKHNIGSRRVLEKCGFVVVSAAGMLPKPGADPVPEFSLRLVESASTRCAYAHHGFVASFPAIVLIVIQHPSQLACLNCQS